MRVLAIDPGYGRCGVAIIERDGLKDLLIHSACIETPATDEFGDRLHVIIRECRRLLDTHKPDCLAMEKLFFNNNQRTAMRVAEVRGAILEAAAAARIPVREYTPGQIKCAAAGWGGADKRHMASMLRMLLKIEKNIKHDDEYDAIAVGITHLSSAGHTAALARA